MQPTLTIAVVADPDPYEPAVLLQLGSLIEDQALAVQAIEMPRVFSPKVRKGNPGRVL